MSELSQRIINTPNFAPNGIELRLAGEVEAAEGALIASKSEVARLRSLVEEAASALVQRGFTDRAQWLRDKAENGEQS